jgi:hypothetical protein
MDVNDDAYCLNKRAALESIASNRASTGCSYRLQRSKHFPALLLIRCNAYY